MNCYIGIDLGGTNLRAAVADTDTGQVYYQRKRPTLAAEGQESVRLSGQTPVRGTWGNLKIIGDDEL